MDSRKTNEKNIGTKNPESIHVGIGEHWVKCVNVYGGNYAMSYKDNEEVYTTSDVDQAQCVVCGRKTTEDCLVKG